MTKNYQKYWERRNAGLCVCCGVKAAKSRCPACMSDLTYACRKSRVGRIKRLEERIRALEGVCGG